MHDIVEFEKCTKQYPKSSFQEGQFCPSLLYVCIWVHTPLQVRQSSISLLSYLHSVTSDLSSLESFIKPLLKVFEDNLKNSRITVPLFKTLDLLLANGVFEAFASGG